MKKTLAVALLALGIGVSGTALAADGAAIYKSKCVACHGADGKGTAMAPSFQNSEFIKNSTEEQVSEVILKGREGAAKKYKNFAIGMPAQKLSDEDTKAVVTYLKTLSK